MYRRRENAGRAQRRRRRTPPRPTANAIAGALQVVVVRLAPSRGRSFGPAAPARAAGRWAVNALGGAGASLMTSVCPNFSSSDNADLGAHPSLLTRLCPRQALAQP